MDRAKELLKMLDILGDFADKQKIFGELYKIFSNHPGLSLDSSDIVIIKQKENIIKSYYSIPENPTKEFLFNVVGRLNGYIKYYGKIYK